MKKSPARHALALTSQRPDLDWMLLTKRQQNVRKMHLDPEWARDLRDQCASAGVPFFLKQMTEKAPIPDDLLVRQFAR